MLTTGDNIYAGKRLLGLPVGDHGDEDDDWFFTFYQPYRYLLNRIPIYPCIGNHDSAETEDRDDREQVLDNFFLRERMATDEATGKASLDPGLFYRVRFGRDVELICLDTSKEHFFSRGRLFEHPEHQAFLEESLQDCGRRRRALADSVLPSSAVFRRAAPSQHRATCIR